MGTGDPQIQDKIGKQALDQPSTFCAYIHGLVLQSAPASSNKISARDVLEGLVFSGRFYSLCPVLLQNVLFCISDDRFGCGWFKKASLNDWFSADFVLEPFTLLHNTDTVHVLS